MDLDDFLGDEDQNQTSDSEQSSSSESSNSSSSKKSDSTKDDDSKTSNVPGDGGLDSVPSNLLGTWYTMGKDENGKDSGIESITFRPHTITVSGEYGGTEELHKKIKNFDYEKYQGDKKYQKETNGWAYGASFEMEGHKVFNTRAFMQAAGDGNFYYLVNEEGQTVLVAGYGAGCWTSAVYWKDEASAKKYANKKFANLLYQDSDTNNDTDDE